MSATPITLDEGDRITFTFKGKEFSVDPFDALDDVVRLADSKHKETASLCTKCRAAFPFIETKVDDDTKPACPNCGAMEITYSPDWADDIVALLKAKHGIDVSRKTAFNYRESLIKVTNDQKKSTSPTVA